MTVRKPKKQLQVWGRGAKSFGDSADVFTHNFPTGMIAPLYPTFQALSCMLQIDCFMLPLLVIFVLFVFVHCSHSAYCEVCNTLEPMHNTQYSIDSSIIESKSTVIHWLSVQLMAACRQLWPAWRVLV